MPGRLWNQPKREKILLQSTELEGIGDLDSSLTLDMEMQIVEFALWGVLLWASISSLCSLSTLLEWQCTLYVEICDLLF